VTAFERVPGNAICTPAEQADRGYIPLSDDTARACEAVITGPGVPCGHEIPLPSVAAVRAYLTSAGWTERPPGSAGSIWAPPLGSGRVAGIGVPLDDGDPDVVRGVIRRVAEAEGRTPARVARTITAVYGSWDTLPAHDDRDEEIARLRGSLDAAEAKLASYDSAISWATSCTACARTLDASIADHDRAEAAEAKLAALAELCKDPFRHIAMAGCCLENAAPGLIRAEDVMAIIDGEADPRA
jgi:hypothetical protein